MMTRGRAWPVGRPAEEGLSLRDRIPREECEVPLIGTSRADGQQGSGPDVARKRHCHFHVDAVCNIHRSGKSKVMRCMSHRLFVLFFFLFIGNPANWSKGRKGVTQYYKTANLRGKTLAVEIATSAG